MEDDLDQQIQAKERELDDLREQRREQRALYRTTPRTLKRLAELIGCKVRSLQDAAKNGALEAWRIGGTERGEIVTTLECLDRYLRTQPARSSVKTQTSPPALPSFEEAAAASLAAYRAGRRPSKAEADARAEATRDLRRQAERILRRGGVR